MKFILTILFVATFCNLLTAQNCPYTFSGHVEDADTRDKLTGAIILIKELNKSLITDEEGDFMFDQLCESKFTLLVSHVSCDTLILKVNLSKNNHLDIIMPHARRTLGEVFIESQKGISNTGFMKDISRKQLEETKGLSLAEALSKLNGVTMLQTGSTISKPVIHGLHGNRILTINNGVRQEGQQWGNEHAPEIDPFIADKLTVIKGVDELKYGSDAIGGVILVEPKPLRHNPGSNVEFNTAYFSNNRQYVASGLWEQALKNQPSFRYRIQGTFKQGATAATPQYRMNNTGSKEANFSVTAGWKKEKFNTELFYSNFNTTVGIFTGSHIGNLTDLLKAIEADKPDDVFLGENSYLIKRPYQEINHQLLKSKTIIRKGEHKFNVLMSIQNNNRKEFDIVRSSTNTKPQSTLSILTFAQDISWEQPKKNHLTGTAGIAMMQQQNSYSGRYFIPNYFSYTFGGYLIEKWSKHNWELQAGLRFDHKTIRTTRIKFSSDTINYDFKFSTMAGSFNTIYSASRNLKTNLGISLATRAPYVNELLSDGIHHGTATYEKGNINLKPEKSLLLSAGMNFMNKHKTFTTDILIYANPINDFIYQQPVPDNPVLTIAGAFPLLEYKQINAFLAGLDVATSFNPLKNIEWQSKLSLLYAKNRTINDWLILMPSNRLTNEITYNLKDSKKITGTYISAEWLFVSRQKRTPDESNGKQDYKAPPEQYHLINVNASANISFGNTTFTFAVGVRNLFNIRYREYLNRMRYFADEMGRNINFRIKIPFN